jgi:hypothetical protein
VGLAAADLRGDAPLPPAAPLDQGRHRAGFGEWIQVLAVPILGDHRAMAGASARSSRTITGTASLPTTAAAAARRGPHHDQVREGRARVFVLSAFPRVRRHGDDDQWLEKALRGDRCGELGQVPQIGAGVLWMRCDRGQRHHQVDSGRIGWPGRVGIAGGLADGLCGGHCPASGPSRANSGLPW